MLGPARFYVGVAALAVPVAMSLPHEPDVASAPLFNSPLAMLGELLALRLERTHHAEAAWMRRLRCHSHRHLQQNGHDQTLKAWIKYRNPHPIHTLIQRVWIRITQLVHTLWIRSAFLWDGEGLVRKPCKMKFLGSTNLFW